MGTGGSRVAVAPGAGQTSADLMPTLAEMRASSASSEMSWKSHRGVQASSARSHFVVGQVRHGLRQRFARPSRQPIGYRAPQCDRVDPCGSRTTRERCRASVPASDRNARVFGGPAPGLVSVAGTRPRRRMFQAAEGHRQPRLLGERDQPLHRVQAPLIVGASIDVRCIKRKLLP